MVGHLPHLVDPLVRTGARLSAHVVPRLDAWQDGAEAGLLHPLDVRLGEEREAALANEVDRPVRHGVFDRVEVVVEAHAEVRIVPADERPLHLRLDEAQVALQHLEVERLIRNLRVDAERAGVGAAEAADHRHQFHDRRLAQHRLDELPALDHTRQFGGLLCRLQAHPLWTMRRAVAKHVVDRRLVAEAEYVVEIFLRVLRVAARMRAAQHRAGALGLVPVAEGVRELRRHAERGDEDQVDVARQVGFEILEAGVAHEADVVPRLLAPHRHHLGHDAREIRSHDTGKHRSFGALGQQVDDSDPEFSHQGLDGRLNDSESRRARHRRSRHSVRGSTTT